MDSHWMQYALDLAHQAQAQGEVPVGAVLVKDQEILGVGFNCPIATHDPTSHAEIQAIRAASKLLNNYRLPETTLYVTLEPCAMCAGAIVHARIARVVFGASDPRAGGAGSVFNILQHPLLNHRPNVTSGVMAAECSQLLVDFFKLRRKEGIC
jgi:tRNA(adenine34) deaminase